MEQLSQLKQYGINITNRHRAIKSITDWGYNDRMYREMIESLTGRESDVDEYEVEYVFKYLVDGMFQTGVIDLNAATIKGVKFVETHPHVRVEREARTYYVRKSELDATGAPKQKKGNKKEIAIRLWKANKLGLKFDDRKGWMEYLQKEVPMTVDGSSTYHYNLKTGLYR